MSLTKLFNKDFFIQNMKRSRSSIIFASILLPIFTVLIMLLLSLDNYMFGIDFITLNLANIFFMYIIPIILSISLFSFVFKKNSTDFIGSMPISRKSIFTTNTIGGIGIIIAIQVITTIIIWLMSIIFSDLQIFGLMILESLLFFVISYIFVFVVCNLAMSFSGNMFATIAATMLILFLIPFLLFSSRGDSIFNAYSYYDNMNADNQGTITFYEQFNFTAPSLVFDAIANGTEYNFNTISVVKMVVLSIIYFAIGYVLFKRKKYEMAEESFESNIVHLIVKFLTLTPFFAIGVEGRIIQNPIGFLFFFAFIAIYYFLFDIITRKKIKASISIASFFAFSIIMYALFALIVPHLDFISKKVVNIEDVDSVKIVSISNDVGVSICTDINVTDAEIIYGLLDNTSPIFSDQYSYTGVDLVAKTKNGFTFPIHKYGINALNKVFEKYGNEKYNLNLDEYKITLGGTKLTNDDREKLRKSILEDIDGITYNELFKVIKSDREMYGLQASRYKDHKIETSHFDSSAMKNTMQTVVYIMNQSAYKYANDYDFVNMAYSFDFVDYMKEANPTINFNSLTNYYDKYVDSFMYETPEGEEPLNAAIYDDEYNTPEILFDGIRNIDKSLLRDYLIKHKDDSFDREEPYYCIYFVTNEHGFYSNDIEGFYKLFASEFNKKVAQSYGIKLNENV